MTLSTLRFDIREWHLSDLDDLYAIYGDEETNRYVDDGAPLSRELCEKWIGVTRDNYQTRGYGMYAIVERDTGDMVGCCGIVHPHNRVEPEIKYAIRRDHWGMGIASEVVPAVVSYGFETLKLPRIVATVDPANTASIRVLEKTGMVYGETIRNDDETVTLVYQIAPKNRE